MADPHPVSLAVVPVRRTRASWIRLLGVAGAAYGYMAGVAGAASTLGDIAANLVDSLESLVQLIVAIAYVSGIAFGVSAILKFKQHKDNPTQITVGQPITLLMISAALVWLPMVIQSTGATLFGESGNASNVGTASGRDIFE